MKANDLIDSVVVNANIRTREELLRRMFEAEPLVHPFVIDAYEQAARQLRRHRIPFRLVGGLAVNFHGAGRPTKDVDLVVRRKDWHRAIKLLQATIATDMLGIPFGLQDEPTTGMTVVGPHGVCIELWPEGTTAREISMIRGHGRRHPAEKLVTMTLQGDELAALITNKLASYLASTDRAKDLADVQALIKRYALPWSFANKLGQGVRRAYQAAWRGTQRTIP